MNLRIPGPTPCPEEVLQASAQQMVNHRGPEFAQVLRRVTDGLNWVFGTSSDVLSVTTSGTGGLEFDSSVGVTATNAFAVMLADPLATVGDSQITVNNMAVGGKVVKSFLSAPNAVKGFALTPLYPRAVELPARSPNTYRLLTLVDALRIGDAKVRNLAREQLEVAFGWRAGGSTDDARA